MLDFIMKQRMALSSQFINSPIIPPTSHQHFWTNSRTVGEGMELKNGRTYRVDSPVQLSDDPKPPQTSLKYNQRWITILRSFFYLRYLRPISL